MKKFLTLFAALIVTGSMMVVQATDYYYRGNQNSWGASLMSTSTDGYYAYISALSYADNGNQNNEFKISLSADGWDYNCSYVSPGFNSTDITNMNSSSNSWNNKDWNNAIYHTTAYYVLVYFPNTTINTSSNPVICASTTLPDNSVAPTPRDFDGSTPLYLKANAINWWTASSAIQKATFTKSDNSTEVVIGAVVAGSIYSFTPSAGSYVSVKFSRHDPSTGDQWNATGFISLSETESKNYISSFSENSATVTWDVYVYSEPDAFVAGSAADIFGTAWTSDIAANKMTWDDGLSKYTKTYTVDKAYKSVSLKVVYDEIWYGNGEANITFSLNGAGDFTVVFDKTSHAVTVEGSIVEAEQFDFGYVTVTGNGSGNWLNGKDWDVAASENRMTEVETDIYEITFNGVAAAESKFQFSFDGSWTYQFGGTFSEFGTATTAVYGSGGGDITFTPGEKADVTIRLDLSNFDFATKLGATFTVTQDVPDIYTVAGSATALFGTSWDKDATTNDMVWDGSVYKFEKTGVALAAGNVYFKVLKNRDWNQVWPTNNYQMTIPSNGEYTITITFDPAATAGEEIAVNATRTGDADITQTAKMKGSWNWDTEEAMVVTSESATFTKNLAAGGYEFKILLNDGDWRANGYTYHRGYTATEDIVNEEGNMKLNADIAGDYTFTWTFATNKIEITFPELTWTEVRSGLTAERYYTVCWPKKMLYVRGASVWSFAGKDANMAYLVKEEGSLDAGKPYIIYAEGAKFEAVLVGDDADAGSNNGLYGTLDYMDADALEAAGATYMLKNNELRPIGTNNHLDANRAYVILDNIKGGKPAGMPAHKVRGIPMQRDAATSIDELNASETPRKAVINGQLFILRGEHMFDATGRLVK